MTSKISLTATCPLTASVITDYGQTTSHHPFKTILPRELSYGSGMTCWRRLRDWTEAGVWQQLHELLSTELHGLNLLAWSHMAADGSACAGNERGPETSPSPVGRARTGSKHHVITGGTGIPLAVTSTGGIRHDVTQLMPLIHTIPSVRGRPPPRRRRPRRILRRPGL